MEGKKWLFASFGSLLLCSCNMQNIQIGGSEGIGTLAGGLLGGALGNQACDGRSNQELCTLVGAAMGAYLGNRIGKRLDEADRQRHAQATAEALAAKEGETAHWENAENGTSGRVSVVEQHRQPAASASIPVLKDRVESVQPLELIGEVYETDRTVNVRVGPGTDYKMASEPLAAGTQFNVVGKVISHPDWLMISREGAAAGYVYGPLVEPTGIASALSTGSPSTATASVQVDTIATCKTVNHEITYENGKKETETVEMCQRGDGSWDLV